MSINDIVRTLNRFDGIFNDTSTRNSHVARKFLQLEGESVELARYGLERYLYHCHKIGTGIDRYAFTEIIDDANHGISYAMETEIDIAKAKEFYNNNPMTVHALEHSLKPFGLVGKKPTP